MTHHPIPLLLFLITVLSAAIARADKPSPSVSFRAVCFDPRETATPAFFLTRDGVRKPLELDKSRLSSSQNASVRNGNLVDFFTSEQPGEGELPALTLTLPAGSLENLLVVIAPGAKGYQARAIPVPPNEFKPGDTLLINAAATEVAVKQGAEIPMEVKPGTSRVLSLPASFKDSMLPVQILGKSDDEASWQIVQSTRWAVDPRFRSYVFLYQLSGNDRLMLHGITERMD